MPTLLLTVTDSEMGRARVALGRYWRLADEFGTPRIATPMEVKRFLVRHFQGLVHSQERALVEAALIDTPFEPT